MPRVLDATIASLPPLPMPLQSLPQILAQSSAVERVWSRGTRRVQVGEGDDVFIVLEGALALTLAQPTSSLLLEIIGQRSMILPERACALLAGRLSLTAVVDTRVVRLPSSALERLRASSPALCEAITSALNDRCATLLERFAYRAVLSVARRVAAAVWYLAEELGTPCPIAGGTRLMVAQDLVAEVAGTSRQGTNRELRHLQRTGRVQLEWSTICVLDVAGLAALANGTDLPPRAPARACALADTGIPVSCDPVRLTRARTGPGEAGRG